MIRNYPRTATDVQSKPWMQRIDVGSLAAPNRPGCVISQELVERPVELSPPTRQPRNDEFSNGAHAAMGSGSRFIPRRDFAPAGAFPASSPTPRSIRVWRRRAKLLEELLAGSCLEALAAAAAACNRGRTEIAVAYSKQTRGADSNRDHFRRSAAATETKLAARSNREGPSHAITAKSTRVDQSDGRGDRERVQKRAAPERSLTSRHLFSRVITRVQSRGVPFFSVRYVPLEATDRHHWLPISWLA
jgi:hypothetical protein